MKKVYEKPRLYVESFELENHIATGGCDYTSGATKYKSECYILVDDDEGFDSLKFFLEGNFNCTDGEATYDKECTDTFLNAVGSYFFS